MKIHSSDFHFQIKIARVFFIISAFYGWLLRLYKVVDLPFNYTKVLQAHSHVTFLGWGFLAVISLIVVVFLPKQLKSKILKRLFLVMVISLVGMLISFPLQGYKIVSIILLSLFLITSYFYLGKILIFIKPQKSFSVSFIKTGIFYYYLSSIAIWAVAIIISKYGKTEMYYNAIYFYLHFLYNGFFVFTLFGLLFKYAEKKNFYLSKKNINSFYILTHIACIPAYALSLLWIKNPPFSYYLFAFLAALLQLIASWYLYKITRNLFIIFFRKQVKYIALIVVITYFIKITLQFLNVFPVIFKYAYLYKAFFIIGYIHLYTLGFMSLFIFLLLLLFAKEKFSSIGMYTFFIGFLISEILLFGQGLLFITSLKEIPFYDILLMAFSSFMPLGLVMIYFDFKNSTKITGG